MSRSLPLAGVLVFGCLLAFTASAQRYDDGSYRPYPGSGQWRDDDGRYDRDDNGPVYDYARVVRVDPIIVDGGGRRGDCYARSEGDYVYDADGYRQERDDARDHGALIVHGHTPVDTVTHYGNRLNIDTGAGYGRALSAVVIEDGAVWQVTPSGRVPVVPA